MYVFFCGMNEIAGEFSRKYVRFVGTSTIYAEKMYASVDYITRAMYSFVVSSDAHEMCNVRYKYLHCLRAASAEYRILYAIFRIGNLSFEIIT